MCKEMGKGPGMLGPNVGTLYWPFSLGLVHCLSGAWYRPQRTFWNLLDFGFQVILLADIIILILL
jgi:hypothetical protein